MFLLRKQYKPLLVLTLAIALAGCQTIKEKIASLSVSDGENDCKTITITGNPDYPPLSWTDGHRIAGAGAVVFSRIAGELGIVPELKTYKDWGEAVAAMADNRADLLFGAYYAKNVDFLDYIEPHFMLDPVVVIFRNDNARPFNTLEDLINLNGVALEGKSFGETVNDYITGNLLVARVADYNQLFDALMNERADYIIVSRNVAWAKAEEFGLRDHIRIMPKRIYDYKIYAAMAADSPCLKYKGKIGDILERMQKDAEIVTELISAGKRWDERIAKQHMNNHMVAPH